MIRVATAAAAANPAVTANAFRAEPARGRRRSPITSRHAAASAPPWVVKYVKYRTSGYAWRRSGVASACSVAANAQ